MLWPMHARTMGVRMLLCRPRSAVLALCSATSSRMCPCPSPPLPTRYISARLPTLIAERDELLEEEGSAEGGEEGAR